MDSDSESSDSDSDDNIETEVITGLEYEYEDMIDTQLFENRAALLPTLSRCFWLCIWTTQSTRTTRMQIAP